ncbi:hypothetical protein ATY79_00625 [Rhizobium sp. R693]|nr:hypothetical protein ATY79_00625 [Rhizobium sp. R693]
MASGRGEDDRTMATLHRRARSVRKVFARLPAARDGAAVQGTNRLADMFVEALMRNWERKQP